MIYYLFVCTIVFIILVICRSCYEIRHFIVKRYEIESEKASSPVKLLYLSDLHENSFGQKNERLVRAVVSERPDCIIIGGDLIIGKGERVETETGLEFLRTIQGVCPVIYSFGNHETRVSDTPEFQNYLEEIKKMDIILLNNKGTSLEMKGMVFYFWGLELEDLYYKGRWYAAGENPFESTEEKDIRVLIAHNPNFFEEYVKWNPDYVFSGHNHGGIVRLPGIKGVISTDRKLFPKYSYGLYRKNKTVMILSAGAGSHTIPFRLFNRPEIVTVQIKNRK